LAVVLAGVLVLVYLVVGILVVLQRRRRRPAAAPGAPGAPARAARRETWRMPPLSLLERPKWSRGRLLGMYALRAYLVVAVVLLFVKAIELGLHK
jgi:hypothetical protein